MAEEIVDHPCLCDVPEEGVKADEALLAQTADPPEWRAGKKEDEPEELRTTTV